MKNHVKITSNIPGGVDADGLPEMLTSVGYCMKDIMNIKRNMKSNIEIIEIILRFKPDIDADSVICRLKPEDVIFINAGAMPEKSKDADILRILADSGECGLSTKEIAENIKLTTRATRDRLKKLIDKGLVYNIRQSPTDPTGKFTILPPK